MAYNKSQAQTSQGVLLQVDVGDVSPASWTTIAEMLKWDFDDKNVFEDTTNTQSLAMEFLPTLPNPGNFTFELNRLSPGFEAGRAVLENAKVNQTLYQFRVQFPINAAGGQSSTGDQKVFWAFVEQLADGGAATKKITTKGSLKITGPIETIAGS